MKLIIQNTRVVGTATDEYSGPEEFLDAPLDFDIQHLNEYLVIEGVLSLPNIVASKIDALWCAADAYVSGFISGVAIGILTIGVIQAKPKCLAVTGWSSAVWGEYYVRKALITPTSIDNLDFSSLGPMPYSVPELQAEVFGEAP